MVIVYPHDILRLYHLGNLHGKCTIHGIICLPPFVDLTLIPRTAQVEQRPIHRLLGGGGVQIERNSGFAHIQQIHVVERQPEDLFAKSLVVRIAGGVVEEEDGAVHARQQRSQGLFVRLGYGDISRDGADSMRIRNECALARFGQEGFTPARLPLSRCGIFGYHDGEMVTYYEKASLRFLRFQIRRLFFVVFICRHARDHSFFLLLFFFAFLDPEPLANTIRPVRNILGPIPVINEYPILRVLERILVGKRKAFRDRCGCNINVQGTVRQVTQDIIGIEPSAHSLNRRGIRIDGQCPRGRHGRKPRQGPAALPAIVVVSGREERILPQTDGKTVATIGTRGGGVQSSQLAQ
mmetsp:Transcript_39132/g.84401  ORF Transcript_39132/g.84401 Transcript_39132/m.84401 type:complete len:351 (-) Transcript_39132:821-1873(-)